MNTPAPPLRAQPVFGLDVDLAAWSARGPVVLVFTRYLGSPHARATLFALNEAYPDFDREGVQLAAVTDSSLRAARDFVPRHHLLFPLICDPEREHYAAFEVPTGGPGDVPRALLSGALDPSVLSLGHGRVDGQLLQRPAAFVVRDGQLRWRWDGPHCFAQAHPGELLAQALTT